jgi:hypothetical protein
VSKPKNEAKTISLYFETCQALSTAEVIQCQIRLEVIMNVEDKDLQGSNSGLFEGNITIAWRD